MAQKWLPASSLNGGSEGSLDAIDGSNLSDGDRAIVIADQVYFYVLDADSGATESSPTIIAPDDNAGDKRWVLSAVYQETMSVKTVMEDYTLNDGDKGTFIEVDGSEAVTITIPADSTHDFEIGTIIYVYRSTDSDVTLDAESGVSLTKEGVIPHFSRATLRKRAADQWIVEIPAESYEYIKFNIYGSAAIGDIPLNTDTPPVYDSVIMGGNMPTVEDNVGQSVVLGGNMPTMKSVIENSAIVGGNMSTIEQDVSHSAIIGGNVCAIRRYVSASAILGGNVCEILDYSNYCVIIGGTTNKISESSEDCVISGGKDNKISYSEQCFIAGGKKNKILYGPTFSNILGGEGNLIGGQNSEGCLIAGGVSNFIKNGNMSFAIGYKNTIGSLEGYYTYGMVVSGGKAHAWLPGQKAHACGSFNYNGDAQFSDLVYKAETMDATETPMSDDVGSYCLPLYRAKSWKFTLDIVARQVGGTAGTVGDSAIWHITGGIKNIGAELARGTVTLSGEVFDGDIVNVGGTDYVFKDVPDALSGIPQVQAGSVATAGASLVEALKAHNANVMDAVYYSGTVVITIFPGIAASSYPLSCTGTNLSCDGSGTFGGTTGYAQGIASLFGTPKGTGAPDTGDSDSGAAAWEVSVSPDGDDYALEIKVTGEADKEIHWVAKISLVEVG
jgi:hypothetical protein